MKSLTFGLTSLRKKPSERNENLTALREDGGCKGSAGVSTRTPLFNLLFLQLFVLCTPLRTIPPHHLQSLGQNIIN